MKALSREKTTTKEYHDKVIQKRLEKRDANVKKNRREHKEHVQDIYNEAYKKVLEIIPEK